MQYKLYFSAHSKVTSETRHNVFEKCFLQSTHHSLREFSNMFKEQVRRLYIWRLSLSVSVINGKTDAGLHSLPDFATCSILTIEKNVENTAFGLYFFNFML